MQFARRARSSTHNRKEVEKEATATNLRRLGFPGSRSDAARQTDAGSSSKEPAAIVARDFGSVLMGTTSTTLQRSLSGARRSPTGWRGRAESRAVRYAIHRPAQCHVGDWENDYDYNFS